MKCFVVGILIAVVAGCSQTSAPNNTSAAKLNTRGASPHPAVRGDETVQMPSIPDDAKPQNGTVVEYWPDGKSRAELCYKSGHLTAAVYYASNGNVVYQMEEADSPKTVAAVSR